jgi:hypothetical protein
MQLVPLHHGLALRVDDQLLHPVVLLPPVLALRPRGWGADGQRRGPLQVESHTFEFMTYSLEAACDPTLAPMQVSNFAFAFKWVNLYRYATASPSLRTPSPTSPRRWRGGTSRGGANAVNPSLDSAGLNPRAYKVEKRYQTFVAFKCNLCRYDVERRRPRRKTIAHVPEPKLLVELREVGLYKLNPAVPQLESAWFQPLNLSSEKPVSSLCFQMQLTPLQ